MKNLMYLSIVLTLLTLVACNTKQKTEKNSALTGIWQNEKDSSISVEFTQNGVYHLISAGKRIQTSSKNGDSIQENFLYDSLSKGINLRIFDSQSNDTAMCKLVFVTPDKINLSLIYKDSIVSEAQFFKIKI